MTMAKHAQCVGKFFTTVSPLPSIDVIEASLPGRWGLSGKVTVVSVSSNEEDDDDTSEKDLLLFSFELEADMKKVVRETWNVNGVTLVLKELPTHGSLSDIDFTFAWFWVKVEGLPLSRYTIEEARRIGHILSDGPVEQSCIRPLKREFYIRVEIDLTEPLHPGFFIGKKRKGHFVQFKYKNLGFFCLVCGMIDHPICGKIRNERPLIRKIRTPVYGPWLRCTAPANKESFLVEFPDKTSERTEDEETVPYKQFFIKLKVEVVYVNEHCWGGKTLNRSVSDAVHEHRFRFPCSYLATTLESNDLSQACEVLAREIDDNVPLVGLTFDEKVKIVERFVDYSKENMKTWSGRRWVPVRICVRKTMKLSSVDFQTKLIVQKDEELCRMIDEKMSEMIKRRVEKQENILSIPMWKTCIQDLMAKINVKEIPFGLFWRTIKARNDAFEYGLRYFNGTVSADKASIQELERVKVFGQDMDSMEPCSICQDGMFLGDEATKMPCSHLFHRDCIEEWLQKGNQCPLCRFEIPSEKRNACPAAFNRYQRFKQHHI